MNIVVRMRSLALWFIALCFFIPAGLIVILLSIVISPHRFDPYTKLVCRVVVRLVGIRVTVQGQDHLPATPAAMVLVCNHVNLFDGFVLYGYIPFRFRPVELDTHFRWPFYGWIIRRLGVIPISRTRPRQAKQSLQHALDALEEGIPVLIMPEGGRTVDGRLQPFKSGPFYLAQTAGVDILPMVMIGADKINRKGSLLVRPGRLILQFGPPVPHTSVQHLPAKDLKHRVHHLMAEMLYHHPSQN